MKATTRKVIRVDLQSVKTKETIDAGIASVTNILCNHSDSDTTPRRGRVDATNGNARQWMRHSKERLTAIASDRYESIILLSVML